MFIYRVKKETPTPHNNSNYSLNTWQKWIKTYIQFSKTVFKRVLWGARLHIISISLIKSSGEDVKGKNAATLIKGSFPKSRPGDPRDAQSKKGPGVSWSLRKPASSCAHSLHATTFFLLPSHPHHRHTHTTRHFTKILKCVLVTQSCPTLQPHESSAHEIHQGKITGVGCHFFSKDIKGSVTSHNLKNQIRLVYSSSP